MKREREEEKSQHEPSSLSSSSTQWEILYGLTSRYAKAYEKRKHTEPLETDVDKSWPTPAALKGSFKAERAGGSSFSRPLGSGGVSHRLLPPTSFRATSWTILVDCLNDTLCATTASDSSISASASIAALHPLPPTIEVVRLVGNDSTTLVCQRLATTPVKEGEEEERRPTSFSNVQHTVPQERGELFLPGDVVLVYDRICSTARASTSSSDSDDDDDEETREERRREKGTKKHKKEVMEYKLERHAELIDIFPSVLQEGGDWVEAAQQGALAVLQWIAKLLSHSPGLGQLTYLTQCATTRGIGRIGWVRTLHLSRFLTSDVIHVSALTPEEERVVLRLRRTLIAALRALIMVFHHVQLVQLPVPQRLVEDVVLSPLFVDGFSMAFSLQSPTFLASFELQAVADTFQDFVRRLMLPLLRSSRTLLGGKGGVVTTVMHGTASVATPAVIQTVFYVVHRLAEAHLSLLRERITSHPLVTATEELVRGGWTRDMMSWLREAEEEVENLREIEDHEIAAEKAWKATGSVGTGGEGHAWRHNLLSVWSSSPKRVMPLIAFPPSLRLIHQESAIGFMVVKKRGKPNNVEGTTSRSASPPSLWSSVHPTGHSLLDPRPHLASMARTYDPYRTKGALSFVESALLAAYVELYGPASRSVAALLSYLSLRNPNEAGEQSTSHLATAPSASEGGDIPGVPPLLSAVSSFFPSACVIPVLSARQTSTDVTIPLDALHSLKFMHLRWGARYGLPLQLELEVGPSAEPFHTATVSSSPERVEEHEKYAAHVAGGAISSSVSGLHRLRRICDAYDISFSSLQEDDAGHLTQLPKSEEGMEERAHDTRDRKGNMFAYVVAVLQGNPVLFPVLLTCCTVVSKQSVVPPLDASMTAGGTTPSGSPVSLSCTIYPIQDGDLLPSFISLARQTASLNLTSSTHPEEEVGGREGLYPCVWLVLGDESEAAKREAEAPFAPLECHRFFPLYTPALTYVDMIQRLFSIRRELQGLSKSSSWGNSRVSSSTTSSGPRVAYNHSPEGLWLHYFATSTLPMQRLYAALLPSTAGLLTGSGSPSHRVLEEAMDELKESVPLTHWQMEAVQSLIDSTVASNTSTGLLRAASSASATHSHSSSVLANLRVVQGTVGSGKTVVMYAAGLAKGLQLAEGRREQQRGLQTILQRTTSAVQEASNHILSASRLEDLEGGEMEKEGEDGEANTTDPMRRAPHPLQLRHLTEVAQETLWSAVADQILAFESLSMGVQYCSSPLLIRTTTAQPPPDVSSTVPSSVPFLQLLFGEEEEVTDTEGEGSGSQSEPSARVSSRKGTYRPEWLQYDKAPSLLTVVEETLRRTANAPLARILADKLQQLTSIAACCSTILGDMEEWENQDKARGGGEEEESYVAPPPLYASVLPFLLSPTDHQAVSAAATSAGWSWGTYLAERIWRSVPGGVVAAGGPSFREKELHQTVGPSRPFPTFPYWVSVELSFTKNTEEESPDPVAGTAFPSSTFLPVERTATHRDLTALTGDQAVGWHAVYRSKQVEWLRRVYAAALSSVQETLAWYEATVYGVASASQTTKYPLITTTGSGILRDGVLPFLWHWSPSHVMIDDFDGLSDGLFLTLPAVSTLTVSSSLYLPGLLAQRRAAPRTLFTDLLHVLQKSAGGGAAARTSLLRQIHRCQREEVHALLQHYSAAHAQGSTLASVEEEGGTAATSVWQESKGEKREGRANVGETKGVVQEDRKALTPLPGLASFSAVEGWSHALPPSRSVEGDAAAGRYLAQYFLRHRPNRLAFLDPRKGMLSNDGLSSPSRSPAPEGSREGAGTSSLHSRPLKFTVVTPFASDIAPIQRVYKGAHRPGRKPCRTSSLPSSSFRTLPGGALANGGVVSDRRLSDRPPPSAVGPTHSLHFTCIPFHYDPMRFPVLETEEEMDVAIVHLSGLLKRLSMLSSASSPWWRHEEAGPEGTLAQRMECWLWRVLSRVRWGVVVLAGRELFARLPALGHLERSIIKNREVLSPSYTEEEEEKGVPSHTAGAGGETKAAPIPQGEEDGEVEGEGVDGEPPHGMGAANRVAATRAFWLPTEVGCTVMAFQCGQHCKSRFIARVALLPPRPQEGEVPPPSSSNMGQQGHVQIVTHGGVQCRSVCTLPYRHCTFAFHACLRPCHFLFPPVPFLSSATTAVDAKEEERELHELMKSDEDTENEEKKGEMVYSTTPENDPSGVEGDTAAMALVPGHSPILSDTKSSGEEEAAALEEHTACPYPCTRLLPRCGHLCQRKCGDRCRVGGREDGSATALGMSSTGEAEEGGVWMGREDGSEENPHLAFVCPPCLVKGLTQLTCGQRVVSGVDPNDGKVLFQTFSHFQTRPCGEGSSSPGDYLCEEPVVLTCRRCGVRSTTPCHVLQVAKEIGRERERERAAARDEVPRGKDEIDADTEDLLLDVTECRGCVNVINRVLTAVELFEPLPVPTEHCARPQFAFPKSSNEGEEVREEEGVGATSTLMPTPTTTMMPVTAKECTFLPDPLRGNSNVHTLLTAAFARETRKASLLLRKAALEISNGRHVENSPLSLCQNAYQQHLQGMEEEKKFREEVLQKEDEKLLFRLKKEVTSQVALNLELDGEFRLLESEALEEFHRQEAVAYQ